ncbi:MFS transporter [Subtercola lobariae]|uniref:MFS transporter n=1 Tax=Subtercola lobariae TaxID=1588641 RepID=A0A917B3X3_9MICO|nr:MFS transporter [Subtercola lobariae]GGF21724.1 MFS transporter [Subtercola lobariae]
MTTLTAQRRASVAIKEPALITIAAVISLLEGFDLACFGTTVPSLLHDQSLGINAGLAGLLGSVTAFGMLLGAAASGAAVNRLGARRLILVSIVVFSLGMALTAVAPSSAVFGIGRFLVGIGLGIVLPTLLAYVADLSAPGRRNRNIGLTMAGYALGGLAAPLLGAALLPAQSFRWIYVAGLIPAIIIFPFALRLFPDSPVFLLRTGRTAEAQALSRTMNLPMPVLPAAQARGSKLGLGPLFAHSVRTSTILFWLMSFAGLLLVFGISTWLPSIMQAAGFSLGSALLQTAVLWVGAGVGMVLGGRLADRFGAKRMVVIAFAIGALSLTLLAMRPNLGVLIVLMFVSGFGLIGSQSLVNGLIVSRYPDALRGSGLSWALAAGRPGAMVGPLLGAWVLTSGLATQWNFYVFAIIGVFGALVALLVPRIAPLSTEQAVAREQNLA